MTLNPIRCDQCIKRRDTCNRKMPCCQTCIDRNVICTYLTKPSYKKQLNGSNKVLSTIKELKLKEEERKAKNISNKDTKIKWISIEFKLTKDKYNIIKLPNRYNWESTFLGILHSFPKKMLLQNLMTILQYPFPYMVSNDIKLLFKLAEKLNSFAHRKSIAYPITVTEKINSSSLNGLLNEAIRNYFVYINSILPLFVEENFNFSGKPLILRLTIITAGLLWIKKNETVKHLLNCFSEYIWEKIHCLHQLKPSLEIIQTLLIFNISLRPKNGNVQFFTDSISCCNHFSIALGLNHNSNYIKGIKALERALVCSCLIYINQHVNVNIAINIHPPTKIDLISRSYIKIYSKLSQPQKVFKYKNLNYQVILCSFYCDNSLLLFSLSILKKRFIQPNASFKELEKASFFILKRIEQIENHYLSLFSQINSNSSIKEFTDHNNYVLFTCHYLRYFIYTLYFYHPQFNTDRELRQSNLKFINIVNKALDSCCIVIQKGIVLPLQYMLLVGIPSLSRCIIFMIRYQKYSNIKSDLIIELGKQRLQAMTEILSLKDIACLNLNLIDTVEMNI